MNSKNEALVVEAKTGTAFTYRQAKPGDDLRYCTCGCGLQVVGKAIYRPGHDAKHVSELAAFIVDQLALGTGGKRAFSKNLRDSFDQLTRPKLVLKLATNLMKKVSESQADTVLYVSQERVIALMDEGDEDGEE